jgi:hypothetical protein
MPRLRGVGVPGLSLLLAAPTAVLAQPPAIQHDAVGCVVAERFPRLQARFDPAARVARARVLFRASGSPAWYAVDMKPEAGVFWGTLPKPSKSTERIDYYIEVIDTDARAVRTAEYAPAVLAGPGACQGGAMTATFAMAAEVAVGLPTGVAGVPVVPAGFAADGVVAGAPAAGTSAGAAAGSAASGGGIGTGAIVAGAVVAAGAGAAAVVASKGDDDGPTFVVEGVVISLVNRIPGLAVPDASAPRVEGAVVSTSLDSRTATTDSRGNFLLITETRRRGCEQNGETFTVTIAKAGCPSIDVTRRWGCGQPGENPPTYFNLPCR